MTDCLCRTGTIPLSTGTVTTNIHWHSNICCCGHRAECHEMNKCAHCQCNHYHVSSGTWQPQVTWQTYPTPITLLRTGD